MKQTELDPRSWFSLDEFPPFVIHIAGIRMLKYLENYEKW